MSSFTISRAVALTTAFAVVAFVVVRSRSTPEQPASGTPAVASTAAHAESTIDPQLLAGLILTVHKDPACGCCKKWAEHMEKNGFKVVLVDHPNMVPVRKELGVTPPLQSCHTSKIGNYVIEGHVPAEDVIRLLKEKPEVAGLAAPGMPNGSPGMEGFVKDKYDVLSFDKNGATRVFSSHR